LKMKKGGLLWKRGKRGGKVHKGTGSRNMRGGGVCKKLNREGKGEKEVTVKKRKIEWEGNRSVKQRGKFALGYFRREVGFHRKKREKEKGEGGAVGGGGVGDEKKRGREWGEEKKRKMVQGRYLWGIRNTVQCGNK